MDFADIENTQPAQEFTLTNEDLSPTGLLKLNAAKFNRCESVVIFVETNQEDMDTTAISRLQLIGQPLRLQNRRGFL